MGGGQGGAGRGGEDPEKQRRAEPTLLIAGSQAADVSCCIWRVACLLPPLNHTLIVIHTAFLICPQQTCVRQLAPHRFVPTLERAPPAPL
jgi:hypothetical protein